MKILRNYLTPIALAGTLLCHTPLMAEEKKPAAMPSPKVDVFVVGEGQDIPVDLEYPAKLTSVKNVTITARVEGTLQKKHYTEGAIVHKGELLYTIEPDIYQAALNSAKATLNLEEAKLSKAEKDWRRANGLYKDKAISTQDKDTAYFAYQTAKASVDVAKAEIQKVSVDLAYTQVKATIDGVAGIKQADVGDYVKVGTPLVNIVQTDPIFAEFSIPNIDKIRHKYTLKTGSWAKLQDANLTVSLIKDGAPYQKTGRVDFVDANVNASTSSLKARAVFNNLSSELIAGEFCKIKLMGIVFKDALVVPQKAVLQNPLGTIVFVLADGKVSVKPVSIIDTSGQNFIVKGVAPKDVVIVNNFFRVKPGMSVTVDKTINK